MKQMEVTLSRAGYSISAVVQIQSGAPADLLLGTDLLPHLGFEMTAKDADGSTQELLQQSPDSAEVSTSEIDLELPVVRLVQAAKLPALYQKMVRAQVSIPSTEESVMLFEPAEELIGRDGIQTAEAAVQLSTDREVTLILQNCSKEPVELEGGHLLGKLLPLRAVLDSPDDAGCLDDGDTEAEGTECATVNAFLPPQVPHELTSESDRRKQIIEALDLEQDELSESEREQLKTTVLDYVSPFALSPFELDATDLVAHSIDTGNHSPIRQPARRMPFSLRQNVSQMIQQMLAQEVICPSHSPWASPIVLVQKKDGSLRFCVDYRRLNAVTKLDVFPLPRIDDSLDLLANSRYFTTLDLATGYWQVKMDSKSQEKTAFVTHDGLYEFRVMPFGLTNAPATFQRLMEGVLHGLTGKCCLVYIDDIVIMGETFEEHLVNLRAVLERLGQAKLKLKLKKCRFAEAEVEYLGHVVSSKGLATDPRKVESVKNFPRPQDLRSVRSFLGLASYYRRFIPCFSSIASPLYQLTKKDAPFDWTASCEQSFEQLKQRLIEAPVLVFPNFEKEFLLETDASGKVLGAVLAQEQSDGSVYPIAYASRTLEPSEKYGVTEVEALAVVWAVKHFQHYLYGHCCHVYTDHEAL